jgi:phosphatidylserine/phosphatidylglycerophosphate/cardiolipin synthase-like enzyme
VIAVVPRFPDQDGRFSGPPNILGQLHAIDALRAAGGDRFGVYDISNDAGTPIYVHAKVCIADDEWLTCGSDNFNRRSWTHDSEATCAVVDPEGRLPRALRISLWAEHLGLAEHDERLVDLAGATHLWRERSAQSSCRARPHDPPRPSRLTTRWAYPAYRLVYDPDGRPWQRRRRGGF